MLPKFAKNIMTFCLLGKNLQIFCISKIVPKAVQTPESTINQKKCVQMIVQVYSTDYTLDPKNVPLRGYVYVKLSRSLKFLSQQGGANFFNNILILQKKKKPSKKEGKERKTNCAKKVKKKEREREREIERQRERENSGNVLKATYED